jgi:hypothetical protein
VQRPIALLLALACITCAPSEDRGSDPGADGTDESWVTIYDPEAAWNGFTLVYRNRAFPMLIDMSGRVVHAWPEVRSKTRARLLPSCNLLVISRGRGVAEYDWEGNKVWRASFPERFPHHDVIRLTNGNTVVLTRATGSDADDVVEVDADGEIVWIWESRGPLSEWIERDRRRNLGNTTHMNSVQELPDNPWYRAGDERFRPGNLLISARNLNLVFILDRQSEEVVWSYQEDLDHQHEALMLGPEHPHNGRIALFDNRYSSFEGKRGSRVIELDPRDYSITWSYAEPGFYSATGGAQQPLSNGNVLIGSSMGRRVFEVDREGRTVWQWTPPYLLNRPSRYAADACPRLADLGPADGPPIRPPARYRHVDPDSYQFSRSKDRFERQIAGSNRRLLKDPQRCAAVVLPSGAVVRLSYGIDRRQLDAAGRVQPAARFSLTLRNPATGGESMIFDDTVVGTNGEALDWRQHVVDLEALAHQQVEVCVGLEESGGHGFAFWGAPVIAAADQEDDSEDDEPGQDDLTAEELEVRREHLRAMGYVN